MHHPLLSLWLCVIFLLYFGTNSFASPTRQLRKLEPNIHSLVPRVFEGWPVAESHPGGWRILLKRYMQLLPVRDAIQDVSRDVELSHPLTGYPS